LTVTFDAAIQRLREHRCQPQKNGSGYWASCPSHDERRLQMDLHVKADDNGRAELKCTAGCDPNMILYDIGLNHVAPDGRQPESGREALLRAMGPVAAARFEADKAARPTASMPTAGKQQPSQANGSEQLDYGTLSDADLGIIGARSVKEAPIDWLWKYRFARGEMALLAGDGGLGKSSLLLSIASLITTGGKWPDGAGQAPLGSVIIVSAEDSRETTLKPRLIALGADLDRIKFVTAKMTIQRQGQPPMVNPVSLQDRRYWQEILKRVPECKMLILDPIPSYLGRGINDAKNAELRAVIEPFIDEVTRPAGVCFVANTHLNKNGDAKTPLHRITGSMAYGALPRNVHIVVRDRDKPERRLFVQGKCNIAPDDLPAVAYSLVKTTVPSPAGEIETAYPVFEADTIKVNLQEAMGGGSGRRGPEPVKTLEIAKFLVEFMKGKGPVFLGAIMDEAGARKLIGEPTMDKGHPTWTNRRGLYKAIDEVSRLPKPDDGWVVVTSKEDPSLLSTNGRARWQLRQAASAY
jgi:energy-coupling factor transporter ATP-binding protein EcfA2